MVTSPTDPIYIRTSLFLKALSFFGLAKLSYTTNDTNHSSHIIAYKSQPFQVAKYGNFVNEETITIDAEDLVPSGFPIGQDFAIGSRLPRTTKEIRE